MGSVKCAFDPGHIHKLSSTPLAKVFPIQLSDNTKMVTILERQSEHRQRTTIEETCEELPSEGDQKAQPPEAALQYKILPREIRQPRKHTPWRESSTLSTQRNTRRRFNNINQKVKHAYTTRQIQTFHYKTWLAGGSTTGNKEQKAKAAAPGTSRPHARAAGVWTTLQPPVKILTTKSEDPSRCRKSRIESGWIL